MSSPANEPTCPFPLPVTHEPGTRRLVAGQMVVCTAGDLCLDSDGPRDTKWAEYITLAVNSYAYLLDRVEKAEAERDSLVELKNFHDEHYPAALSRLQVAESTLRAAHAYAAALSAERDRLREALEKTIARIR